MFAREAAVSGILGLQREDRRQQVLTFNQVQEGTETVCLSGNYKLAEQVSREEVFILLYSDYSFY